MRIYAFRDDMLASQRSFLQGVGVVIMNADALHPCVNFKMDDGFFTEAFGSVVDLLKTFDGGGGEGEVVLNEIGDLLFPDAAQNEDRGFDAHFTQENPLFEDSDADIVCVRGEVTSDHIHAVPVGVGFENDHYLGGRCFLSNGFQVLRKVIEINCYMRWTYTATGNYSGLIELHRRIIT